MNQSNNRVIQSYLKDVSARLVYPRAVRSVFISELKENILNFAAHEAPVSLDDLYKEFGSPDDISEGFLDRKEYSSLLKKSKRKMAIWICIGIIAFILFVVAICCFVLLLHHIGGEVIVTDVYN